MPVLSCWPFLCPLGARVRPRALTAPRGPAPGHPTCTVSQPDAAPCSLLQPCVGPSGGMRAGSVELHTWELEKAHSPGNAPPAEHAPRAACAPPRRVVPGAVPPGSPALGRKVEGPWPSRQHHPRPRCGFHVEAVKGFLGSGHVNTILLLRSYQKYSVDIK